MGQAPRADNKALMRQWNAVAETKVPLTFSTSSVSGVETSRQFVVFDERRSRSRSC